MRKRQKSTKLEVIRKMPPLRHSIPGNPFRVEDSEVIRWMMMQPAVLQYIFDKAKDCMKYDPHDGTWRGADYEG